MMMTKAVLFESFYVAITFLLMISFRQVYAHTYNNTKALFDDRFNINYYNTAIIPLDDQNQTINVNVSFGLVSIIEINDVRQTFVCTGILGFQWNDERLAWNPADYGGVFVIHPKTTQVWNPKVFLVNTVDEPDPFEDNQGSCTVGYNGDVHWSPEAVFSTSCGLDITNYPFDKQTCTLRFVPDDLFVGELLFHSNNVETRFFAGNSEWELISYDISSTVYHFDDTTKSSSIEVSFTISRRPTFVILNIIVPVMLLSFINILIFAIPAASGERISYGVSVLLALSVFLSITGGMLPRSAENVPRLTVYITMMLVMSVMCVVGSVLIIFLNNLEENEDSSINIIEQFQTNETQVPKPKNKYSLVCRYIDKISFVVFLVFWIVCTLSLLVIVD